MSFYKQKVRIMKELKKLFENNKKWICKRLEEDPSFFNHLSYSQQPSYLWIGCSDSRVPANEIVGLGAGELFVHRNIGNLFLPNDMNCLAVLEYAIDFLKIKHVILCGHYGCGAIKAAMEGLKPGITSNWLHSIRDLYENNKVELEAIEDIEERYDRLSELNVSQQVQIICNTYIVQEAWKRNQPLWIHGWIYDLKTGQLIDQKICISKGN